MSHKLIRTSPGALSNMDREALAKHRAEKQKATKLEELERRVESLEQLVRELINGDS